jgi:GxxExxY protein
MGYQPDVKHDDLTDDILNRAIEVHRELGPNQRESTYRNALGMALEEDGFEVDLEVDFAISFRDRDVGKVTVDMLVDGEVILELKVVNQTTDQHLDQLGRGVRNSNATRGLLLNFGRPTLDIRRYVDGYES